MTQPLFVDTSAWYALADRRDARHDSARRMYTRLRAEGRRLATTNHVVSESYTLMRMRLGHSEAQEFLRRLQVSSLTRRFFVPEAWEAEAESLLARYVDQDFSYVDALSFVAMRRLGLDEAFAFDQHFATAGFRLVADT